MRKNNESTVKERDVRFDLLKGIMIFLVVFGHLIGDYKANHVVHTEWPLIYLFHILYLRHSTLRSTVFLYMSPAFWMENVCVGGQKLQSPMVSHAEQGQSTRRKLAVCYGTLIHVVNRAAIIW